MSGMDKNDMPQSEYKKKKEKKQKYIGRTKFELPSNPPHEFARVASSHGPGLGETLL